MSDIVAASSPPYSRPFHPFIQFKTESFQQITVGHLIDDFNKTTRQEKGKMDEFLTQELQHLHHMFTALFKLMVTF